jgi:hypothetical protein
MADTASPAGDSNVRAYLDISTEHVTEPVMGNIARQPGDRGPHPLRCIGVGPWRRE